MADRDNQAIRTTLLVVAGGLVGATVALLFAPQSGKRTRRDLVRLGNRVASRCEDFQIELKDRLEDLVGDVVEAGSQGIERGKEVTGRARDEVVGTLKAGRDLISQQLEKVEKRFGG